MAPKKKAVLKYSNTSKRGRSTSSAGSIRTLMR